MPALTINDRYVEVPEGTTVLQAARRIGITIPTLCDHPALTPYGGCRLCVVEVAGARFSQAACTLRAADKMVVRTESEALAESRRSVLSLLLSTYHDAGYSPDHPDTEFERWVKQCDAKPLDGAMLETRYKVDSDPNPFVWVDLNKCILCSRCVRACAEVQGRFVWGLFGRGYNTRIAAGANEAMLEARCESCGACAAFCPTGALDDRMSIQLGRPDKRVTTTCTYCGVGCQLDLNVKGNRIIRVTSNPDAPVNGMALCVKGRYGYDFVHHPDRLKRPRVRKYLLEGEGRRQAAGGRAQGAGGKGQETGGKRQEAGDRGEWVEVDWDTALDIAARKLREARDAHGADSVGVLASAKCLNEENYLMNKFARQVIGTNNIDHCARL